MKGACCWIKNPMKLASYHKLSYTLAGYNNRVNDRQRYITMATEVSFGYLHCLKVGLKFHYQFIVTSTAVICTNVKTTEG